VKSGQSLEIKLRLQDGNKGEKFGEFGLFSLVRFLNGVTDPVFLASGSVFSPIFGRKIWG
jgi:hypothetical protein